MVGYLTQLVGLNVFTQYAGLFYLSQLLFIIVWVFRMQCHGGVMVRGPNTPYSLYSVSPQKSQYKLKCHYKNSREP